MLTALTMALVTVLTFYVTAAIKRGIELETSRYVHAVHIEIEEN